MKLRVLLPAALASLLTACVAPSQPFLDQARADCTAGREGACRAVPGLQSQVSAEKAQQAREVGQGILLGLTAVAVGAAAGYAASRPAYYQPVVVVCRPWWAC